MKWGYGHMGNNNLIIRSSSVEFLIFENMKKKANTKQLVLN